MISSCISERLQGRRSPSCDRIKANALQSVRNPLRRTLNVLFVLCLRTDAGYAQKFVKIRQMLVTLSFDILIQLHLPS